MSKAQIKHVLYICKSCKKKKEATSLVKTTCFDCRIKHQAKAAKAYKAAKKSTKTS